MPRLPSSVIVNNSVRTSTLNIVALLNANNSYDSQVSRVSEKVLAHVAQNVSE